MGSWEGGFLVRCYTTKNKLPKCYEMKSISQNTLPKIRLIYINFKNSSSLNELLDKKITTKI